MPKINLRRGPRRILVSKKMIPINPFDFFVDDEKHMPPPFDPKNIKMRIFRFLPDGREVEVATCDGYFWRCVVRDGDGKVIKEGPAYSEASARAFVEEYQ